MAIYQSMQRVRFSSTDDYEKFKIVFGDVRHHLKTLPPPHLVDASPGPDLAQRGQFLDEL